MKSKHIKITVFACAHIAFLVYLIVLRGPTYDWRTPTGWFDKIRSLGETNEQPESDAALDALRHLGKLAVPALQKQLKSSVDYRRAKAAWVLGQMGPLASNAVPDLIHAIDDKDIRVQNYSICSLAAIRATDEKAVPKLIAKVGGGNPGTAYFAAVLLDQIEQDRKSMNLPPIRGNKYDVAMRYIRASLPSVRVKGAYRLANLSLKDERVTAALQLLLNDTNGWVRERTVAYMKNPSAIKVE